MIFLLTIMIKEKEKNKQSLPLLPFYSFLPELGTAWLTWSAQGIMLKSPAYLVCYNNTAAS